MQITVTETRHLSELLTAPRATMARINDEVERDVANRTKQLVYEHFDRLFRRQTGYYLSQLHVATQGGERVVTDGGVVYGPWLEGVGSRNSPVTRFRGYAAYRRARRLMQRQATQIGNRVVRRYTD